MTRGGDTEPRYERGVETRSPFEPPVGARDEDFPTDGRPFTREEVMDRFFLRIGHLRRLNRFKDNQDDIDGILDVLAHTVRMTPAEFDELPADIITEIAERVAQDAERLTGKVTSLNSAQTT